MFFLINLKHDTTIEVSGASIFNLSVVEALRDGGVRLLHSASDWTVVECCRHVLPQDRRGVYCAFLGTVTRFVRAIRLCVSVCVCVRACDLFTG